MLLFSVPESIGRRKDKLVGNFNIQANCNNRPTNHIQLLSQHPNSAYIWDLLLLSPSHFRTNLSRQSGYHFDSKTLITQAKEANTSIVLSEEPISSLILADEDHLAIIDNSLADIKHYDINVDRLSILGIQKHLCSEENYSKYMDSMFNILRLSDIRSDYGISEVVLRQSNKIVFNLNSIRRSDLPEQKKASHCGLTMEEACQLMRYIGSVQDLNNLEICSVDFSQAKESSYYNAISMLIWYMMEGITFRQNSQIAVQQKQYVVYPEGLDLPLYFYNESSTDKWWVNLTENKQDLIACSPLDFENARNGKYSERLIKIMEFA